MVARERNRQRLRQGIRQLQCIRAATKRAHRRDGAPPVTFTENMDVIARLIDEIILLGSFSGARIVVPRPVAASTLVPVLVIGTIRLRDSVRRVVHMICGDHGRHGFSRTITQRNGAMIAVAAIAPNSRIATLAGSCVVIRRSIAAIAPVPCFGVRTIRLGDLIR